MTRIEPVDVATLKSWLDAAQAIVLDVREMEEYEEAHIDGAILIPVETCGPATLPHNPDKHVVFYCKKGGRAARACKACTTHMPQRAVYNLEGGLEAWEAAGLPLVRGVDAGRL